MLVVNIILALVAAITIWYVVSTALAVVIFRAETRHPGLAGHSLWNLFEGVATFIVFAGSVALWIVFTWLLESAIR
jgi:hypothetical protein